MKVNVENIKVLKVEANGEVIVFKADDIISLEYKAVSIKGRIAQIGDTNITVDCSTMYNSQIHEVNVKDIEIIVKENAFNKQREDKIATVKESTLELEEYDKELEVNSLNSIDEDSNEEDEDRALEPILTAKEKPAVPTLDATDLDKEKEELDDSVSLFGNIKRNYAQGISPIFNK